MQESTWQKLCREIMNEKDPERLFALADALNKVLDHPQMTLDEGADLTVGASVC